MNKVTLTYITLFFCFASFILNAQIKSTVVKNIDGKKYYIHKVEKGQSLYAISKIYEIDINSILALNDEAIDGLKNGQELKIPFESLISHQAPVIDTNKYVYHKIQKGETIFSITKKFSIDEKKIKNLNPSISNGLKEGDYIIVSEKQKKTDLKTIIFPANDNDQFYTVSPSETIYGIAAKLKVSQDDLLLWNPELKDGLKQGQVLRIISSKKNNNPSISTITSSITTTSLTLISKDSIAYIHKVKKSVYHVGLLLPFKLDENETIIIDDLIKNKSTFPVTQSLALDFYYGFKLAIDSLISKDFDITIHLFDIDENDSLKAETICATSEFKNLDILFGPLYADVFKQVSGYAKKINIPIISPLTQQNKILYNNFFVSKVNPSQYTLIESLADYTVDSLSKNSNIIIVNSTQKDQPYIKSFKSRYNSKIGKYSDFKKDTLQEVKGILGVKNAYKSDKKNVVILLTNNQVYLQDFITQLYVFSDNKNITLMGFNSVANIDNLDQDYLNKLQFHFATQNHLNYQDSSVIKLVKQYQSVYTTDPSDFYFQGYDIANYYLSNLKTNGPEFFYKLEKYNAEGNLIGFKFYRPDNETGFENRAVYIYKYSNYQLQKIGWK